MKRKIALLLSVIMMVIAMIPVQVFAEGDKGLESAIKLAKSKFSVPENYTEFNYNISTYGGKKIWYLNWNGKDGMEGSINVSVDEKGNIMDYNKYIPEPYPVSQKIPKVSKQQAKEIADEFIKNLDPEMLAQLKYEDNQYNSIHDSQYYLSYARIVNDIPFYSNSVGVSVNRQTGDIRSYHCNWNGELEFPAMKGTISMEKAQQAFKDKMGLELKYQYTIENEKIKIFAAFAPKYGYGTYIDALTGEKLEINPRYGFGYNTADRETALYSQKASASAGSVPVLTDEELKAVEKVSKLISKEEAEKIARSIKTLELTDEFKARNYNLSKSWPDREEFVWSIDFMSEGNAGTSTRYVHVAINAVSGEIKAFNTYYNHSENEKPKYDENAAKAAAESMLKELQPEKFKEVFFDGNNSYRPIPYITGEQPTNYNFSYTREINGIPFPGNALRVGYDAINGKITNYSVEWFATEFPSVEKVASLENVYEKLFKEIGLEFQYVAEPKIAKDVKVRYDIENPELQARLVYGVKTGKPVSFDAYTGEIINYDGQPYKEIKPIEYSDVAGHFAENQIKVLAEYGIALEGTEFKPDQNITQKEFLTLLSKTLNYYYMPYPVAKKDAEVDSLYAFLIREGIVKEGEKAPEGIVTREDAVKFVIRALKYDKVADLQGIFRCDFKDIDKINAGLVGYVAIAKGLGIINGYDGYFNPAEAMSRGQTAIVIYNYLQQ